MPRRLVLGLILMLGLFLLPGHLQAQNLWSRIDSLLIAFRSRGGDSLYVQRPQGRWTFKLIYGMTGNSAVFDDQRPVDDKHHHYTHIYGDKIHKISVGANYRGIGLVISGNPARLTGKLSDLHLNLTTYSNKFGLDVVYDEGRSLSGKARRLGETSKWGDILQKTFTVSGYFVLNHKRFSYPAAFTQTWIQKRSAGSVLFGANYQWAKGSIEGEFEYLGPDVRGFDMRSLSIGAGYGYNFVPHKNWLIHASLLPSLILMNEKVIHRQSSGVVLDTYFPEFHLRGSLAVVFQKGRFFYGANLLAVYSYNQMNRYSVIMNGRWRLRFQVGFRY